VRDLEFLGPPHYFRDAATPGKPWGITNGPLRYAPAVDDPAELCFVQQAEPDAPDLARCWVQAEPVRRLPSLAGIPILILVGEASYHAAFDHCTSKYLRQAGVEHDFIRLESLNIRGNGHMLMLERNNHEIAGVLAGWLHDRGL
jgi:hypothetical protein